MKILIVSVFVCTLFVRTPAFADFSAISLNQVKGHLTFGAGYRADPADVAILEKGGAIKFVRESSGRRVTSWVLREERGLPERIQISSSSNDPTNLLLQVTVKNSDFIFSDIQRLDFVGPVARKLFGVLKGAGALPTENVTDGNAETPSKTRIRRTVTVSLGGFFCTAEGVSETSVVTPKPELTSFGCTIRGAQ